MFSGIVDRNDNSVLLGYGCVCGIGGTCVSSRSFNNYCRRDGVHYFNALTGKDDVWDAYYRTSNVFGIKTCDTCYCVHSKFNIPFARESVVTHRYFQNDLSTIEQELAEMRSPQPLGKSDLPLGLGLANTLFSTQYGMRPGEYQQQ